MFKKTSLYRAVMSALLCSLALGFIACQQPEAEIQYVDKIVSVPVFHLSEDDLICGEFEGKAGHFWIAPDFVFNQSVATTSECTEKDASFTLTLESWYQDVTDGEWKQSLKTYNFKDDGNPAYVVYNDEDHLSGVLIFKTKYSAYGTPAVGCYYGIKFQFDKGDSSKLLIEGGYSEHDAYNNVDTLEKAVEMFAFDNDTYYNPKYWNEDGSGATRKTN